MPFVPVADTLLVESVFNYDGQIVENTSYFTKEGGWDEASVSSFLDDIRALIETDLLPFLSTIIQLIRVVGTLLDAADALSLTLNVSPPVSGSDSASPLPNNSSYAITFQTAGRGRSKRGRNYIAGLTTGSRGSTNTVTSTFRTNVLAYYDALLALGTANGATMVVVSRFSGVDVDGNPIPRVAGVVTPITGFGTADMNLDAQRRRLPGRGE
jgi:hypothetical protein